MSSSHISSRKRDQIGSYRILVVDDDPFLSGEKYDLIVLDVMMPKIDGLEVCKVIREKFSLSELPVLMLAALTDAKDIALDLKAGANDYATKPIKRNELIARVKDLLFSE